MLQSFKCSLDGGHYSIIVRAKHFKNAKIIVKLRNPGVKDIRVKRLDEHNVYGSLASNKLSL